MLLSTVLLIIALFPSGAPLSCYCPEVPSCPIPTNCKGGLVPDECNCCKVCAKVEGESCGGLWNSEGTCGIGLNCVNIDKKDEIGRCQKVESLCGKKKCGFKQTCSITKNGKAVCICPRNCRESKLDPVCGIKNGIQYKNPCEHHRHECRSGRQIESYNGRCKKCQYHGKAYRFKETRRGHAACELCVCYHGKWACYTKKHCQITLKFCTVLKHPITHQVISTCPKDFSCKVQIPGIPEQNIPGMGKCVPNGKTATNGSLLQLTKNTSFVAKPTSDKATLNICHLPLKPGSCRASTTRWYFNTSRRKCVKFAYSGCDGNANNFRTKSSCRNTCMRRKGNSSKSHSNFTKPTAMVTSRRHHTTRERTQLHTEKSSKNMMAICQLPPAPGPCRAAMPQWYYNPKKKRCSRFIYGGCGGNDNNFDSKDECKAACMQNKGSKLTHTTESVARLSSGPNPTRSSTRQKTTQPTSAQIFEAKTISTIPTTSSSSLPIITARRRLRSKALFKCPCSECRGRDACTTLHGCFTSKVQHPDGNQTLSYGCLINEVHYMLMCNIKTQDNRQPKIVLECCKGHMCNYQTDDPVETTKEAHLSVPSTASPKTATFMKHSSLPEKPRCYDAHSKKFFGETEEWKPNDCTVCVCHRGQPACVATVCRHPSCLDPIRVQGQCCPVCNKHGNITENSKEMIKALAESQLTTVLVSIKKNKDQQFCEDLNTGELYLSGQNWKVDDCTTCYCQRDGKIACAVQMCSGYPRCKDPVQEQGHCCPVCKEDVGEDVAEEEEEEEDEELIYPELEVGDSPNSCLDPVTRDFYKRSEMWQQDDCTACICGADRKYQCRKSTCKPLKCEKTIKLKGRCCPACSTDTKSGCSFEGQKFLDGEYKLLADHCTLCECSNSEWICSSRRCRKQDKSAL